MAGYIGVKCPVCKGKFAVSDDIVVCPVCGAPHHRHCYNEKGECVFAAEHLSGKEWHAPAEERPPQAEEGETKQCPACGASNPEQSVYCQVCGRQMFGAQGQQNQQAGNPFQGYGFPGFGFDAERILYGGLSPEDTIGEESVRDMAGYIGPNAAYFLPRFKLLSAGASRAPLNICALLLSYFYFFYRKMYRVGALLLLVSILTLLSYMLYLREMMPELIKTPEFVPFMSFVRENNIPFNLPSDQVDYVMANLYARIFQVMRVVNISVRVFFGLLANKLYYRRTVAVIPRLRSETSGMERACYDTALARSGGVSGIAVLVCGILVAAAFVVLSQYVFQGIF